jgi:uridine kinase
MGVDGVDGAGKTVFGGELAAALERRGHHVVAASVDGFHHPRARRYARGRHDPDGCYEDSYDDAALRRELLDPFAPGGDRRHRRAVHDLVTDAVVDEPPEAAPEGSLLVVDGVFLQRPELREAFDLVVFLDVPFEVSCARLARRDGAPADPADPANQRYVQAQLRYLRECRPADRAALVIDNTDLDAPRLRAR